MLTMPTADALSRYLDLVSQQMKLTAANMANQNTAGYTRRSVAFTSGDSVSIGGRSTSTGVTAAVTAQRDSVLQNGVWQANEAASASSTRSAALDSLQSLFAIDKDGDDAAGIGKAMSDFFNNENALSASPLDPTTLQATFASLQAVASSFNRASAQLAAQTGVMDQQVAAMVPQVNALLSTVAGLNLQILTSGTAADTSALQDQRSQAVTQISSLLDVSVTPGRDGSLGLSLSNGTPLVMGYTITPLTTRVVSGVTQIYSGAAAVTSVLTGGRLGGALQVRDRDITSVATQLDAIASAFATQVQGLNRAGTNSQGYSDLGILTGTTAATITVSPNILTLSPSADGSYATKVAALATKPLVGTQTLSGALSSMISGLGQTASAAQTKSEADAAVLTQTSTQLENVSGVSLDTEAANLTQYQRSYQAAAKVLSIVNELMAQAINLGTGTTAS